MLDIWSLSWRLYPALSVVRGSNVMASFWGSVKSGSRSEYVGNSMAQAYFLSFIYLTRSI